ncbi:MAG: sec-independent protein translocase protein TatC [Acidobacteriota bacterium]|jgi:sec-independent protein translocase protein TatC|nr:sec-independent protein translocase protein TatC [Acidobacteriota bacterium]
MASTLLDGDKDEEQQEGRQLGGQMSFLEHLDELRRRLIRSAIFIFVALVICWFVSDRIYNFLAVPVRRALAEAAQRPVTLQGITGHEEILSLNTVKEGDSGRYVFDETTKLGRSIVPAGASVAARVALGADGKLGVFTDEPLFAGPTIIPKGVRLPVDFSAQTAQLPAAEDKLVVHTAVEPFSLYLEVSLYAALCLSVPFLLYQVWAFVAPGLYPHERGWAIPFVLMSSISFVAGAAFAYYVLFPPAISYLLGLGQDFRLFLNASDYFDFIIIVMLAMGVVFQMPAVTYVLSRIGLVDARFLVSHWRVSCIVILVAAAVLSPTNDIPNMMLFAAPMFVLYIISIFIAWMFARPRTTE